MTAQPDASSPKSSARDLQLVQAWDRNLSLDEIKRLRPEDKGNRARTSLTRKVELLELWGRNGLPPGACEAIPWSRTKLRRWFDPEKHLWAWVDPQVDATGGRHGPLMNRFRDALKTLDVRSKDRGLNQKKQVDALLITIANLELQNARLLDQIAKLQKAVGVQPVTRR